MHIYFRLRTIRRGVVRWRRFGVHARCLTCDISRPTASPKNFPAAVKEQHDPHKLQTHLHYRKQGKGRLLYGASVAVSGHSSAARRIHRGEEGELRDTWQIKPEREVRDVTEGTEGEGRRDRYVTSQNRSEK
ncbi:hypothetical protein E2C01_078196 [Portunus trituberculatus]|uniref:Uncharacterized protein n=1 Tax=Portunus trituberculatus TaxID=210409 RepID=A0A5B7ITH5_PORTR|nr:hypothetical protein [Portunus trituberculatus]